MNHLFSKDKIQVQNPFDVYLFFTTLLLVLIGIMMIFSSSAILAQENYGDTYFFLKRQLIYFSLGLVALFVTRKFPYQLYGKMIYLVLLGTAFLMALTFIPGIGHRVGGATRWIKIAGFTLQPSEWCKVAVILFVAYMLQKKKDRIRDFKKGFLPLAAIAGVFILMILAQRDLGSAFVLGSVVFLMLFVSRTRMRYLFGLVLASLPALYFLIFSVSFRRKRILAFLDPWKHQQDSGFQIIQSFVAFQSGGFSGVGLGESKQKLFYLPEAHTDFIFSVLGEEFGWLGVFVVVCLFLFFIYRGLVITFKTKDDFGFFLALGLTSLVGLQAFINFGVVLGLLPTKGLVLPFISFGGTSLIVTMAAVGILLNVSTQTCEQM